MRISALPSLGVLLMGLATPAPSDGQVRNRLNEARLQHGAITASTPFNLRTMVKGKRIVRIGGLKALFKPPSPTRVHGIRPYTDARRERAVYVAACEMGLDVAPPTVLRKHRGKLGSIQLWVRGAPGSSLVDWGKIDTASTELQFKASGRVWGTFNTGRIARLDWDSVHAAAILDYVTNGRDRHFNNFLTYEQAGRLKIMTIDSGIAFAPPRDRSMKLELKTALHELVLVGARVAGQRSLSAGLAAKLRDTSEDRLARRLRQAGLSGTEVRGAIHRLRHVKRLGLAAPFRRPVSGLPAEIAAEGRRLLGDE
jgi:hypothetical protein